MLNNVLNPFYAPSLFLYPLQWGNKEFFRAGEFPGNKGASIKISSTTHEGNVP